LGREAGAFFSRAAGPALRGGVESRRPALLQDFRAKTLFFPEDSEQEVFRTGRVCARAASASSVAKFRMRLDSWLRGTSTEVENALNGW